MPKGPPSPRRSSRARTTQPPSAPSAAPSNSGASSHSSSSNRAERPTRSSKQASPQKSSTPHSLSPSEEQLDASGASVGPTRRSRRQLESVTGDAMSKRENANDEEDEIIEDNETTRCLCGFTDYPGPPIIESAIRSSKTATTALAVAVAVADPDSQVEEPGSMFIQCDTCEVWQHGGCVSIMDEKSTPENYFCEQCRPDFHLILRAVNGQKYSRYLPVVGKPKSHRKPSISKDWDAKAVREALKVSNEPPKRRSTMNSRATFDEDEMLRKVLEQSKQEDHAKSSENGTIRKGKRGREESDDARSDVKRQRPNSSEPPSSASNADSAEGHLEHGDASRKKTSRGTSVRSQKDKEQRDKELQDKERERVETTSKRKGRAERRRADDPESSDEKSKPALESSPVDDTTIIAPANEEPAASTPTNNPLPSTNNTSKRNPPSRSKRRGGRANALTDGNGESGSPSRNGKASDSPKDPSRDGAGSGADSSGTGAHQPIPTAAHTNGNRRGRPGRDRHDGHSREPTMTELKRRAAFMLEFISRSQKEMADGEERGLRPASGSPLKLSTAMSGSSPPEASTTNGVDSDVKCTVEVTTAAEKEKAESEAKAALLADELATRLVKWQQVYTGEAPTAEA